MKGIAQNNLRVILAQFVGVYGFHAAISPYRHKDRGFDNAMIQGNASAPRGAIGRQQFKMQRGIHACRSSSMASP